MVTSTMPFGFLVTVHASSRVPLVPVPLATALARGVPRLPRVGVARDDAVAGVLARPTPVTATAVTPATAATPATPASWYLRLRPRSTRPRRTVCSSGTSNRTCANESRTAVMSWSSFIAAPVPGRRRVLPARWRSRGPDGR